MSGFAKDFIYQSIQDAKLSRLNERRKDILKKIDFYSGTSIDEYIKGYFDEPFDEVPVYEMNITKKFINKMSKIYTLGAVRNSSKKYRDLTKRKDASFKQIERMTRLLGSMATQVTYDETKGFCYHPIYFFIPHFNGNDPFNPVAISYPILPPVDDPSFYDGSENFAYFDDEWYLEFTMDGKIVREDFHGLGRMPVVFTHRESQLDSFFVEGANDIINCNTHVNITLTELQLGLRFQMFGQQWATGVPEGNAVARTGTDTIISLPEGANYGIASPGGDLRSVIDALKFQIELVAQSNHMFVQFAQDGGETPSGIALQIKDLESFEDFKDDIELWRQYENDFYETERIIASASGFSLPAKFGIDFIEPEYPKTEQEQILRDDWDLRNGQTTLAEIMVRENKDIALDEAEKKIQENLEKNVTQLTTFTPPQLQTNEGEESENEDDDTDGRD